jgi:hypothetical protein
MAAGAGAPALETWRGDTLRLNLTPDRGLLRSVARRRGVRGRTARPAPCPEHLVIPNDTRSEPGVQDRRHFQRRHSAIASSNRRRSFPGNQPSAPRQSPAPLISLRPMAATKRPARAGRYSIAVLGWAQRRRRRYRNCGAVERIPVAAAADRLIERALARGARGQCQRRRDRLRALKPPPTQRHTQKAFRQTLLVPPLSPAPPACSSHSAGCAASG